MRQPAAVPRPLRSVIAFDLRPLAGVPLPIGVVDCLPFAFRRLLGRMRPRMQQCLAGCHAIAAAWQRRRLAALALRELRALDDRTLHDLGLHDSEIESVVNEIHGDAEPTRVHTLRGPE